ncbi:BQ5605_C002g01275 [Microbotryum silenes-dioicae]|uniref:BQ5605_C002g01275 protein n=1 Tax=Microbotryum silenes-dioicae TaxID=796604 RepID=A0A2X0MK78_9BASI|nr:BQ5605_C002g01275 [Microbotryum silenes-dioicae]
MNMNGSASSSTDNLFSLALNSDTASYFGAATAGDAPLLVQQRIERVLGRAPDSRNDEHDGNAPEIEQQFAAMASKIEARRADLRSNEQRAMAFGKTEARVAAEKRGPAAYLELINSHNLGLEETGQSHRFTLAVCRPLFRIRDNVPRAYSSLVYPSGSSSTLLQSSSRASTTRHPAPAAPLPDPAFSRSTSSDARTSRSSPVHADDRNGGRLFTPAARSARGRLSGAQLGLKRSASHAPSPSPAEAMQVMPISKEESRKGKGVQRFASGKQAEEEEDWGKRASVDLPGRRRRQSERG